MKEEVVQIPFIEEIRPLADDKLEITQGLGS